MIRTTKLPNNQWPSPAVAEVLINLNSHRFYVPFIAVHQPLLSAQSLH